ncbi:TPA: HNH endonuclease [Streptococcus suis]|nr:HNH endonuclease [Streptococcus suis]
MTDYRFTKFEIYNYSGVMQEKIVLGDEIDTKAINSVGQHYDKIKRKDLTYYDRFEEIYHHKCAYCGVGTIINPAPLYEIDHFFNKKQKTFGEENISVDHISNLIFACRNCNQAKKEFDVSSIHDATHPDTEEIGRVFNRGNHFEIEISKEYYANEKIQYFYNKMNFGYRFRKLDYLLLNLYSLKEKTPYQGRYERLFNKLLELRNTVPSLKKYE